VVGEKTKLKAIGCGRILLSGKDRGRKKLRKNGTHQTCRLIRQRPRGQGGGPEGGAYGASKIKEHHPPKKKMVEGVIIGQ